MLNLKCLALFATILIGLYTLVYSEDVKEQVVEGHCDALTGHCPYQHAVKSKQQDAAAHEGERNATDTNNEPANQDGDFTVEHHGGLDNLFDPEILESIIPAGNLNRKKLKMLGATGFYIRDFSGDVYEYAINDQWEGVWVHLSFVNIRIYGEIGQGRWRFAFSGIVMESESQRFPVGMKIVVKSVNDDVLKEQKEEEAVKRALQTQTLARKIAYMASKKADPAFGKFPEIIKVWMFKTREHAWMVEEKLDGLFKKLINNDFTIMSVPADRIEDQQKAAALAHFSYELTDHEALITDLQGVGLRWTDIEIATNSLSEYRYFGIGNLGRKPFRKLTDDHQCSKFCKYLHLPEMTPRCGLRVHEVKPDIEGQPEDDVSSGYETPKFDPNNPGPLKNNQ